MSADELFQPTVPQEPRRTGRRPWALSSQFWIAFFGGVLPLTIVAIVNATRLGMSRTARWSMGALALLTLGIVFVLWLRRPVAPDFVTFVGNARDLRLAGRIAAVALFLALAAIQRRADSRYQVLGAGEYASLWKFGFAVTMIFGTVQSLLIAWLAWISI